MDVYWLFLSQAPGQVIKPRSEYASRRGRPKQVFYLIISERSIRQWQWYWGYCFQLHRPSLRFCEWHREMGWRWHPERDIHKERFIRHLCQFQPTVTGAQIRRKRIDLLRNLCQRLLLAASINSQKNEWALLLRYPICLLHDVGQDHQWISSQRWLGWRWGGVWWQGGFEFSEAKEAV